ncbi:MAG: hypothetical protein O3C25_02370 [Chloroflexi bacterium]|nr:hypothetical protein [Chloroflexota bacterium]
MLPERPEDTDIRSALGELLVAFSEVEIRLQQVIWTVLGVDDDIGSIVTSGLPTRELVRIVPQLCEAKDLDKVALSREGQARQDAATAVEWLVPRLRQLEEKRNTFVHSWWPDSREPHLWGAIAAFDIEGQVPRWKAPRRTGQLTPFTADVDEIRGTAAEAMEVAIGLAVMVGIALVARERFDPST